MDFKLTDEQRAVQELGKRFAKERFSPIEKEYWIAHKHPHRLLEEMAPLGLLGANVPEKHLGDELDSISLMLLTKELAKVSPSFCLSLLIVQNSLVAPPLVKFGTFEQIEFYLKRAVEGTSFGCFGLTEPGCGSDAANVKTRAIFTKANEEVPRDHYRLFGTKNFITNVTFANFIIILARTDESVDGDKRNGLTAFVVPNIQFDKTCSVKEMKKIGLHSSPFGEIHFENTIVYEDHILGKRGEGFKVFMDTLISGRVFIAAQAWGAAEAAFEDALGYTKERNAFDKPLIEKQTVAHTLADMAMAVKEAEFWTLYTAGLKDAGSPELRKYASMAKVRATEIALFCADKNVLLHGGSGYTEETFAGRLYADVKAFEIYEGANPIQRDIIANELKK